MEFWEYGILFLAGIAGGFTAFGLRSQMERILKYVLAFSGAFILGIIFIHLVPEVFEIKTSYNAGLFVLLGFLLQIVLESLSGGVEHGHVHSHKHDHKHKISTQTILAVLIGLGIHSFIEGLPLTGYQVLHADHAHANHLLWGIILHKAPAAFALMVLFMNGGVSLVKSWLLLILFSLMSPLGAMVGNIFQQLYGLETVIIPLTAIVIGSLFHISVTILFESDSEKHRFSWKQMAAVIVGLGLAVLTMHSH